MTQQHETQAQKRARKLEESVTTVTILNALFVALPQGVHPYFQVQMSAIAQALAEISHCPHRLDSAHRLEQLVAELADTIGQPDLPETVQDKTEPEAVNVTDPTVTEREQEHEDALRVFLHKHSSEEK